VIGKFINNVEPFMRDSLLQIPDAFRSEASDALCDEFGFEFWRVEQDPVIEDTPANRLNFLATRFSYMMANQIRNAVKNARRAAEDLDAELNE
jgi:hypothetical protein